MTNTYWLNFWLSKTTLNSKVSPITIEFHSTLFLTFNSLKRSDAYVCLIKLSYHWFRQWLGAWQAPSHYLNQSWNIVNWTQQNNLRWNIHQNTIIFIQENAFEDIVWMMTTILSQPQLFIHRDNLDSIHGMMSLSNKLSPTSVLINWLFHANYISCHHFVAVTWYIYFEYYTFLMLQYISNGS